MGLQTAAARERIAAAAVLTGRARSAANRDSLAESLVGDREPVAALALTASGHFRTQSDGSIQCLRLSLVSRHVSISS